jgi:ankyrin repeat protein
MRDLIGKLLQLLWDWWLVLVFWKPLRRFLPLLKRTPLRQMLSKEELRRAGYRDDLSTFIDCARRGPLDKVQLFLDSDIDVNAFDKDGDRALIAASLNGQEAIVRLLLDQPQIDVNVTNNDHDTALIVAARAARRDVVALLVQARGINLNARNTKGESALIAAIRSRAGDVETLLANHDADDRDGEMWRQRTKLADRFTEDIFVDSCARGETDTVGKFLTAGMNVNVRAANGDRPLIAASREGRLDVIERLLQDPTIDINLTDSSGNTALIVAARHNHENVIRRLLNHAPVDVSAQNQKGETALVEAARRGFHPIATLLMGHTHKKHEPAASSFWCVDENVQFTVYRPNVVRPAEWYPLLAAAHLTELRPGEKGPAPLERVQHEAQQILSEQARDYARVTQDSSAPVAREREITFVPTVPDVEFNPPSRTFIWLEDVHTEKFRLRASQSLDGQVVRGRMSVFLGSIVLADIPLSIRVDASHAQASETEAREPVSARPYRKIFASYSHQDLAIVQQMEMFARSLGDRYLRDLNDLRAGEVWNDRLKEMIKEADVFQLFWSWNAMASTYVRREWEHALKLNRADFIRPTYWEEPLPKSADGSLPPADLLRLHFARIPTEPTRDAAKRAAEETLALEPDLESKVARWQLEQGGHFSNQEMLRSIRDRDAGQVRKLLVAGMRADDARDEEENTPLLLAASTQTEVLVHLLLKYGAKVNARNRQGDTALLIAARKGRDATVNVLLESGADVQLRNSADESALLEAARREFRTIIEMLEEKGAKEPALDRKVMRWQLEQNGKFSNQEMLHSIHNSDIAQVRKLLVAGMRVDDVRDDEENTPLLLAAARDHEAIVRLLIEYGANVDARNRQGDTALLIAARHGRDSIVKVLLESGADVQHRNRADESALLEAARREFRTIIEMLEQSGAEEPDLNRKVTRWQLEQEGKFTHQEMLRSIHTWDIDQVRKLLIAGMPADDARDEEENTPLLLAAEMDHDTIVPLLLEYGTKVNARNQHGDTALLIAARHGRDATVKVLLESGAEVQARNKAGESALLEAARREFQAIVAVLEDKGAKEQDLEQKVARWQLERENAWTDSLFVRAARVGDCDKVKQYLRAKQDVNAFDERRQTALIAAAGNDKAEMVRLLLKQPGIGLNLRDEHGSTAAELAAFEDYEEIVVLLATAGAVVPDARKVAKKRLDNTGQYFSPAVFVSLAKQGDETSIILFLNAGMPVNAEDEHGRMALIEAARAGHTSLVKLLLDKGADPELRDRFDLSAREIAERNGHLDIAKILGAKGAKPSERSENQLLEGIEQGELEAVQAALASTSPNVRSDEGTPALMAAVLAERRDIVAEMLTAGANTAARDREGKTCLMRAAESGLVGIMRLLLGNKPDRLDDVDSEGRTALILAAWEGQAEAVKVLIEAGADPRIRDKKRRTALVAAKTKGHTEVAKILEGQGVVQDFDHAGLLLAAALGDDKRVAELLAGGSAIDLEVPDEAGNTALALAAARGWTRTLEALMNAGAKPDAANSKRDTPLMQAARAGQIDAVRMLLEKGGRALAKPTNTKGETALFQAAILGRGAVVALLAVYTDQPDRGSGGRTPLIEMCYQGDVAAVKALIKNGAKVNQQQVKFGKSPLMVALLARHTKVVEVLKENGASAGEAEAELFLKVRSGDDAGLREMNLEKIDLDARNRTGWTALMIAADAGDDGIVKVLLNAKAGAGQPNAALLIAASKGRTGALALLIDKTSRSLSADTNAMIEAAKHNHAEAVRLLVKDAGAAVDGLERGTVPLIEAAAKGHLQTVKVLLELGAKPKQKNKLGMTALKAAWLHKHEDVATLLVRWGGSTTEIKEARLLRAAGDLDSEEIKRLLASDDPPDIDARDGEGRNALMIACRRGVAAAPVVQVLLDYYGDQTARERAVQEIDSDLQTPLMFAAMGGSDRIVSKLMNHKPDLYAESKRKKRTALMEACKSGSYQSVNLLHAALKATPDTFLLAINHQDKDGKTPLSEALLGTSTGHSQIVKLLTGSGAVKGQEQAEFVTAIRDGKLETVKSLSEKVDLHTLWHDGKTPLMLAVEKGCVKVAKYLIEEKGVDVDQRGPSNATALILAAGKQRSKTGREMVELLLKNANKYLTDDNEASALLHAIENGNNEIAKVLIEAGADVNRGDNKRVTPLALAVAKDNSELVGSLLRAEPIPDLEVWSDEHRTALTLAHLRGEKTDLTEDDLPRRGRPLPENLKSKLTTIEALLIDKGARKGWNEAELILAIQKDDEPSAKKFMKRADIQTRDREGNTPLLIACANGNLALAKVLIKQDASPAVRNAKERTPLIEAAKNCHIQLVDVLLNADPNLDLNAQDKDKDSALLEAARAGAADVVCRLLDPLGHGFKRRTRGASIEPANQSGETPLIVMARHQEIHAVRALLECGANACGRTARHRTAIIEAAAAGNTKVLEVLIKHLEDRLSRDRTKLHAVINAVDNDSQTALDWAQKHKHEECAELLREHGGKSWIDTDFTVFTMPHGRSYHRKGCSQITDYPNRRRGKPIPYSLQKALLQSYELCRTCRPGEDPIDWTWTC